MYAPAAAAASLILPADWPLACRFDCKGFWRAKLEGLSRRHLGASPGVQAAAAAPRPAASRWCTEPSGASALTFKILSLSHTFTVPFTKGENSSPNLIPHTFTQTPGQTPEGPKALTSRPRHTRAQASKQPPPRPKALADRRDRRRLRDGGGGDPPGETHRQAPASKQPTSTAVTDTTRPRRPTAAHLGAHGGGGGPIDLEAHDESTSWCFGLCGDVQVVGSGPANGSKHLSSDLLWSTHDSVVHAVWLYSLWECILTRQNVVVGVVRDVVSPIFCVLPSSARL